MSQAQVTQLLERARSDRSRNYPMYALGLTTGMRQGELLGLTWAHDDNEPGLDLDRGVIRVRQQVVRPRGKPKLVDRAKRGSIRNLYLDATLVDILRQHHTRLLEDQLRAGSAWQENGLVFPSITGRCSATQMSGPPGNDCSSGPACRPTSAFTTSAPRRPASRSPMARRCSTYPRCSAMRTSARQPTSTATCSKTASARWANGWVASSSVTPRPTRSATVPPKRHRCVYYPPPNASALGSAYRFRLQTRFWPARAVTGRRWRRRFDLNSARFSSP